MSEHQGCPQCGNPVKVLLGVLGNLTWYRCRGCGWEYDEPTNATEEDEDGGREDQDV